MMLILLLIFCTLFAHVPDNNACAICGDYQLPPKIIVPIDVSSLYPNPYRQIPPNPYLYNYNYYQYLYNLRNNPAYLLDWLSQVDSLPKFPSVSSAPATQPAEQVQPVQQPQAQAVQQTIKLVQLDQIPPPANNYNPLMGKTCGYNDFTYYTGCVDGSGKFAGLFQIWVYTRGGGIPSRAGYIRFVYSPVNGNVYIPVDFKPSAYHGGYIVGVNFPVIAYVGGNTDANNNNIFSGYENYDGTVSSYPYSYYPRVVAYEPGYYPGTVPGARTATINPGYIYGYPGYLRGWTLNFYNPGVGINYTGYSNGYPGSFNGYPDYRNRYPGYPIGNVYNPDGSSTVYYPGGFYPGMNINGIPGYNPGGTTTNYNPGSVYPGFNYPGYPNGQIPGVYNPGYSNPGGSAIPYYPNNIYPGISNGYPGVYNPGYSNPSGSAIPFYPGSNPGYSGGGAIPGINNGIPGVYNPGSIFPGFNYPGYQNGQIPGVYSPGGSANPFYPNNIYPGITNVYPRMQYPGYVYPGIQYPGYGNNGFPGVNNPAAIPGFNLPNGGSGLGSISSQPVPGGTIVYIPNGYSFPGVNPGPVGVNPAVSTSSGGVWQWIPNGNANGNSGFYPGLNFPGGNTGADGFVNPAGGLGGVGYPGYGGIVQGGVNGGVWQFIPYGNGYSNPVPSGINGPSAVNPGGVAGTGGGGISPNIVPGGGGLNPGAQQGGTWHFIPYGSNIPVGYGKKK